MERESNSLIYLMKTCVLSNLHMSKEDLGFSHLDTWTHYVRVHREQLQIMLLSENIGLDFFLGKNLNAYAVYTHQI